MTQTSIMPEQLNMTSVESRQIIEFIYCSEVFLITMLGCLRVMAFLGLSGRPNNILYPIFIYLQVCHNSKPALETCLFKSQ